MSSMETMDVNSKDSLSVRNGEGEEEIGLNGDVVTQNTTSKRSALPDGPIVVRNNSDREIESQAGVNVGTASGDSPSLPVVGSLVCVACGAPADSFCAQCGVTPYCSTGCQRRDLDKAVYDNLASGWQVPGNHKTENFDLVISPIAPLRRYHSTGNQNHREEQSRYEDVSGLDSQQKKLNPTGSGAISGMQNNRGGRQGDKNNNFIKHGGENADSGRAPAVLEVPRPNVENNKRVVILEAEDLENVVIRRADVASQLQYNFVIHDIVLYGRTATPLEAPPKKGQTVVGKYSDGLHYRALCLHANVKRDKYLLEYIELGNRVVTQLKNIYPCPAEFHLSAFPTVATVVSLKTSVIDTWTLAAKIYIKKLKDSSRTLVLRIPGGARTAPSGTEVHLTVVGDRKSVNAHLEHICIPKWITMELLGVDVLQLKTITYGDLGIVQMSLSCSEIHVLDISLLEIGTIGGCMLEEPLLQIIHEELPKQIEEYCKSKFGGEPYVPAIGELCIAYYQPSKEWRRAVCLTKINGAGGLLAYVYYVDYGTVQRTPVSVIRKMLPEFVKDLPAIIAHFEINDFPRRPTEDMLVRALRHIKFNNEGQGVLRIQRMKRLNRGAYVVYAPELIAAMIQ